ncbi:MAG: redox-sensing transcriptional repressor Rex [Clostridia bacterium]|nr:redox-sensing transcriptional repressor Rex [Clostridia bacterium]
MNKDNIEVSKATLNRLPLYLKYLYQLDKMGVKTVSSTLIAGGLNLNPVQVRKDIAVASSVAGKPKTGYVTKELIVDLESFLGYDNTHDAVLVGVGGLGSAFLGYNGFEHYGLNIAAAFDVNPQIVGSEVNGKLVQHIDELEGVVKRYKIRLGIITVPSKAAQEVADVMVKAGIKAIWNFAPVHLNIPSDIEIKTEDLAANLALLCMKINYID